MRRRAPLPVALAAAGACLALFGLHQELLAVRPGFEGSIRTGWGGDLNHTERLLGAVAVAAVPAAALAGVRRRAGYLVQLAGAALLGMALRATLYWIVDPMVYTGLSDGGRVVVAAEPYLLAGAGLLLVVAGVEAVHRNGEDAGRSSGRRAAAHWGPAPNPLGHSRSHSSP